MSYALLWGLVAAVAALALGEPLIAYLRGKKLGKAISEDGPQTHMVKAGTPTMGGLLFTSVAVAIGLIAGVPKDNDVLLPVAVAAVMCAIGWYDDLGTLIGRASREAHSRTGMLLKLAGFAGVSVVAALLLYGPMDAPRLLVPHYGAYDIGLLYIPVVIFVFIAMTSAVGVTDGLDSLAGSTTAAAFAAFGVIALMQSQTGVATFCFGMVGALMGFLWFNAYPARVFMGDSGSLPLGACLAIVGFQTGWWLLLPVIGIVFVAEIAADVIQIGSYRLRHGKRVFRMAPLHCHFEKLGMPETQITARFFLMTVAGALAGIALAALD